MASKGTPRPVLGYRTQREAIAALYEQRIEPLRIAEMTGSPINSVHRAIHEYRVKTGRLVAPVRVLAKSANMPATPRLWDDGAQERRMAFYKRAVRGARAALKEMGAQRQ